MQTGETQAQAPRSGTGILTGPASAAGKLAILRQALAETCRVLVQSLSPGGDTRLELSIVALDLGKAGDVLAAHAESVATAALGAGQWNASLLAGMDRDCLYAMIDALFGGGGAASTFRPDRNLTRIEMEVVAAVFRRVAGSLERGFDQSGATSFVCAQVDSPPSFECIGRPSSMVAVATLDVRTPGGGGRLFIAFPQSVFVFLRAPPPRAAAKQAVPMDPQWRSLLGNRVYGADVTLTAVLGSKQMTLGEIADLRLGQIIEIDSVSGHLVTLDCNDQPLYRCKLAQANGFYSLNVEDAINHEQEFMDDILSH